MRQHLDRTEIDAPREASPRPSRHRVMATIEHQAWPMPRSFLLSISRRVPRKTTVHSKGEEAIAPQMPNALTAVSVALEPYRLQIQAGVGSSKQTRSSWNRIYRT